MAPEYPALTDAEVIKQGITAVQSAVKDLDERLTEWRDTINAIGENIQWLVNNTQGLFQFLSNPAMVSQVMGSMMGGMSNAGQPGPEGAGPAEGTDA
jgi:prophage DNA circulation protein